MKKTVGGVSLHMIGGIYHKKNKSKVNTINMKMNQKEEIDNRIHLEQRVF